MCVTIILLASDRIGYKQLLIPNVPVFERSDAREDCNGNIQAPIPTIGWSRDIYYLLEGANWQRAWMATSQFSTQDTRLCSPLAYTHAPPTQTFQSDTHT